MIIANLFTSMKYLLLVEGSSLSSAIDPTSLFFWLSFASSQVSAALGLATILKNGVARVLGDGGACDGLCAGQFLLVFFACFSPKHIWLDYILTDFVEGFLTKIETSLLILPIIAIQLCFSLFCTIGWSKKSAKTIINQPTLILLPIFTLFTFSKMTVCCGGKQDVRLKLSKLYSVINFIIKTLIRIPTIYYSFRSPVNLLMDIFYLVGALLTFIFLYCAPSCGCRCTGCVGGQQIIHVYDPDLPDQGFFFQNGKVIRKDKDIVELDET